MDIAELDAQIEARAPTRRAAINAAFAAYADECRRLGLPLLSCTELPLRPFVLNTSAAVAIQRGLLSLRSQLAALDPEVLAAGASNELRSLWERHRRAPGFFDVLRPDLRQEGSRFDLNVGTATAVTCFETDLLQTLYGRIFEALDLNVDQLGFGLRGSVIKAQCASLRKRLPGLRRVAALLLSSSGADHEFDGQMAGYLEQLEQELGIEVTLTTPAEGMAVGLLQHPDTLIFELGTADMAVARVRAELAEVLAIPDVELRWYTSPFTSVYEKILLPTLSRLTLDPEVFVPEALPVDPQSLQRLVDEQPEWVMKHGRNLKRVLVGERCATATWKDAAQVLALGSASAVVSPSQRPGSGRGLVTGLTRWAGM